MANALIPLGVSMPDFAGAYGQGAQVYQNQQEQGRQNALRKALEEYGPAAMRGDQGALGELAKYDPSMSMGLIGDQQQMDMRSRADQRAATESSHGMKVDDERLALARRQAAEQTAEHAAKMSEMDRQVEQEAIDRALAGATQAKTPQEWDSVMSQNPATADYVGQFEHRDMLVATALGVKDALSMGAEQEKFRQATPEEAAAYGAVAGQFGPNGRFYSESPPSGMAIESDGSGGFRMTQGPGVANSSKPLNEGQSKNVIYATRAEGALPTLDATAGALTSRMDQAAGAVPLGLGRDYQNPEYQQAEQAGREFLTAILRKDSGAAITRDEEAIYGDVYLPRPGDSPDLLKKKAESRRRAIDALRRGMTPAELLALGKENPSEPAAMDEAAPVTRYRYNPETDDLEPSQ